LISYAIFIITYAIWIKKKPQNLRTLPLEDQDIILEATLDDDNILLISHVLKINPYEPLLFLRPFKKSVQLGKKTRHLAALVGVIDTKLGRAMCGYLPKASDWRIHGVEMGMKERE
jgi:hypothetical protein